jgi:ferredoxin
VGASAKIAALLAEAALDIEATPALTLRSDGTALVYGEGETALAAAQQLVRRLNVTLLLKDARELQPPSVMNVSIFRGHIRQAIGHLGAFRVTIDDYGVYVPSSRGAFRFEGATNGAVFACALILDLSGDAPLFPAPERRNGYVRVEPSDAVRLQRALFDLADLVGEFEKPRFLKVDPAICAHARNGIVGCDLCLNVCPTGAITPAGDYTQSILTPATATAPARASARPAPSSSICPPATLCSSGSGSWRRPTGRRVAPTWCCWCTILATART